MSKKTLSSLEILKLQAVTCVQLKHPEQKSFNEKWPAWCRLLQTNAYFFPLSHSKFSLIEYNLCFDKENLNLCVFVIAFLVNPSKYREISAYIKICIFSTINYRKNYV